MRRREKIDMVAGSSSARRMRTLRASCGGFSPKRSARRQRCSRVRPMHGPNFCARSKPRSAASSSSVTVAAGVAPLAVPMSAAGEEKDVVTAGDAAEVPGSKSPTGIALGVVGIFSSSTTRSLARDAAKSEVMVPGVPVCRCGRFAAERGAASASLRFFAAEGGEGAAWRGDVRGGMEGKKGRGALSLHFLARCVVSWAPRGLQFPLPGKRARLQNPAKGAHMSGMDAVADAVAVAHATAESVWLRLHLACEAVAQAHAAHMALTRRIEKLGEDLEDVVSFQHVLLHECRTALAERHASPSALESVRELRLATRALASKEVERERVRRQAESELPEFREAWADAQGLHDQLEAALQRNGAQPLQQTYGTRLTDTGRLLMRYRPPPPVLATPAGVEHGTEVVRAARQGEAAVICDALEAALAVAQTSLFATASPPRAQFSQPMTEPTPVLSTPAKRHAAVRLQSAARARAPLLRLLYARAAARCLQCAWRRRLARGAEAASRAARAATARAHAARASRMALAAASLADIRAAADAAEAAMTAAAAEARAVALEREVTRASVLIQRAVRGLVCRRRVSALRRVRDMRRCLPPPEGREWAARVRAGISTPGRARAPPLPPSVPVARPPRPPRTTSRRQHQPPTPLQPTHIAERVPKAAPPSATAGGDPCRHGAPLCTASRAATATRQPCPSAQRAVPPSVANRQARAALRRTLSERQRELSQVRSRRRELEAELAECKAVERATRRAVSFRHASRAFGEDAAQESKGHAHSSPSGAEAWGGAPSMVAPLSTEAPRRALAGHAAVPAPRSVAKDSGLLWHTLEPPNEHQVAPAAATAPSLARNRDAGGTAAARQNMIVKTSEHCRRVLAPARRPHAQQIAVWRARA